MTEILKELNKLAKLSETTTAQNNQSVKETLERADTKLMEYFAAIGYNGNTVTGQDNLIDQITDSLIKNYQDELAVKDSPAVIAQNLVRLTNRVFSKKFSYELGMSITNVHGTGTGSIVGKLSTVTLSIPDRSSILKEKGWDLSTSKDGAVGLLNTMNNLDNLSEYIEQFGTVVDYHICRFRGRDMICNVSFSFDLDKLATFDLKNRLDYDKPKNTRAEIIDNLYDALENQDSSCTYEWISVLSIYFCSFCKSFAFKGQVAEMESKRVYDIKEKGLLSQKLSADIKDSLPTIAKFSSYADAIRASVSNKFSKYGSDYQHISIYPFSITVKLFPQNFPETTDIFASEDKTIALVKETYPNATGIMLGTNRSYKENFFEVTDVEFYLTAIDF